MIEEQLQKVLDYCREKYHLPIINMMCNDDNCCYAGYNKQLQQYWITISNYWLYADEPATAMLLHEIAHIIIRFYSKHPEWRSGHGAKFKYYENKLLLDFGLKAEDYENDYYYTLKTIDKKYTWNLICRQFSILGITPTFTFGKQLQFNFME